jgi:uncharacterized protein YqeY
MSLHEAILADLTTAMKERNTEKLGVLRLIKAALLNAEKSTAENMMTDEDVLVVLQKEAKKRKDSIEAFTKGDRVDLAATEQAELKIIEQYLPAPFTDDEVRAIIMTVIKETPTPNFGAVMGPVMQQVGGRADGKKVKELIQEQLS